MSKEIKVIDETADVDFKKVEEFIKKNSSHWIPITERMPDPETWVLLWFVTIDPEGLGSGAVIGQRSSHEEGKFWDGNSYRPMDRISHWMPIPNPPPKPWTRP